VERDMMPVGRMLFRGRMHGKINNRWRI